MTYPSAFANYSQLAATGISLSSLSISTLSSGFKFWHEDRVNVPLALAIGIPAVVPARIGSRFAKKLSGDALALFFNGFSIVLIPTHFYIQHRATKRSQETYDIPANIGQSSLWQHAAFGVASGIASSLMGVGGLPLTMSYITEATGLPHQYVQGTAVCALIPSILVSAYSRMSVIPLQTVSCVAIGAAGGGLVGAKTALPLTNEQGRYLFMGSLVLFGTRSAIGASRNIRIMAASRSTK